MLSLVLLCFILSSQTSSWSLSKSRIIELKLVESLPYLLNASWFSYAQVGGCFFDCVLCEKWGVVSIYSHGRGNSALLY